MTGQRSESPSIEHRPDGICAAAATPPGLSGLAVIRLSGGGSAALLDRMFQPFSARISSVAEMPGYSCAPGRLVDPEDGALIDQIVLTRYVAPHSFTGEEMIELSCHGGSAVKQAILDSLFGLGVRAAEPGEFTRRAFLNGKLDLTQAEAVMDLIQADAARSARQAAAQLQGGLSRQIRQQADALYRLLAQIELSLEFPEHDDDFSPADLDGQLAAAATHLRRWADSYRQGRVLREGLTVVIAGRPNAGKSSLLNALAGHERAIVTAQPGTTRDTVEALIEINGLPVRLIDTAGLRETTDEIEQLGVDRTRSAMRQADLVFWLIAPPVDDLIQECAAIKQADCPTITPLVSKDDLAESVALRRLLATCWPDQPVLTCSALTGDGLDLVRQTILAHYERLGSGQQDDVLLTSSRHFDCVRRAASQVAQAAQAWQTGMTLDIVASLVRGGLEALAELTGDRVSDELVQTVFARFCVGK